MLLEFEKKFRSCVRRTSREIFEKLRGISEEGANNSRVEENMTRLWKDKMLCMSQNELHK